MSAARRDVYRHADLARMLNPRSIAVIGASQREGSFGGNVLKNLVHFDGAVYPVNPRYERIGGLACYPSVKALPQAPDCVVIAAAREAVEELLGECAGADVGGVVIFASGFSETGKEDRIAQQARITALAREAGIRVVGPNTIGLVNAVRDARLTFQLINPAPKPGRRSIGIVSQSGALGFALAQAAHRDVPICHVLTSGNSCDVDMADYISFLADEPDCAAIACVFEGTATPERVLQAADIAWAANKPLVVFKIAIGEQGAQAAMSHTGSLAGSQAAYRAAFERHGAILVNDYEALLETTAFFAKAPAPKARGVAVVATSGGAAIMCADQAERFDVPLPQPRPAVKAILEEHIPEFGSSRNPCDVTAQVLANPASLRACAEALMGDAEYGAMVLPHAYAYPPASARIPVFDALAKAHDKVVCSIWVNDWLGGPGMAETEAAERVALFRSVANCFFTLNAWHRRAAARAHPLPPATRLAAPAARENAARLIASAADRTLTEREAKSVLAEYGIPVVGERLAHSAEEAAQAATALGLPAVLKVESPDLPHKTEAGVIRLNLRDAAQVRAAYDEVMANAARVSPPPRINGVLVQPMVPKGAEMVIGARIDPLFGPLIVVGLGGVLVELLKDTVLALAPVGAAEARGMIERLRGIALLKGFRDLPPVDLDRLAEIVARASEFAADQRDAIAELDINPLICAGDRIVAVDALIIRAGG
jgi:acyl-CoA synthetase (NDP forming)